MKVEYVARAQLAFGPVVVPKGQVIPPDLMQGRNMAPWVRQGLIELRGPGADEARQLYRKMDPLPVRSPREALIRQAQIAGKGAEDLALEKPLLEVDDEYGEALEAAGHTVDDAIEAAAEGRELENESEIHARIAEGVSRRRRRRR